MCVHQGHCLNMGSRLFGRCWHAGDVVGCMINMEDKSMIFTLNGEILITTKGSELCFTDFETEDGEEVCMCVFKCGNRVIYTTTCQTDKVI